MFAWLRRLCLAGVLATSGIPIWAQAPSNWLSVPEPFMPGRNGSLVLHGGGPINDQVFERFIQLAGGKNARIVFVPSAGFRRGWYDSDEQMIADLSSRYSSWVQLAQRRQIASFQFLFTDDPDDADNPQFTKPLESATGVWFSGGDQLRLNYRFVGNYPKQTLFQRRLIWIVQRGGVVGGTSAGTAAMPEVMTLWDERKFNGGPAVIVPGHGLGLLRQAIVEQHFDARGGRMERFISLLRDDEQLNQIAGRRGAGQNMVGLAVEETAAMVLQGNRIEALGNADVHIFMKQPGRIIWQQMSPGQWAIVDNSSGAGPSLVVRDR